MTVKPHFDDRALTGALRAVRVPATFDRAGRVALIGAVAKALLDGRTPDREAARYVGGALLSWLEGGGDLARDYLKVIKRHSHHTPNFLWQQMLMPDERQRPEEDAPSAPHTSDGDTT